MISLSQVYFIIKLVKYFNTIPVKLQLDSNFLLHFVCVRFSFNFYYYIVQDGSSFNGLYTKCWLKRNELPLNEGCYVNEALKFFNYPSQKAGWEGRFSQNKSNMDKIE